MNTIHHPLSVNVVKNTKGLQYAYNIYEKLGIKPYTNISDQRGIVRQFPFYCGGS